MGQSYTPWLAYLETLRPHLKGRDHRGRKGSLRWLEARVAEKGGRSGTVRNILYKDLGSPEEKARLYEVIAELYGEVGLTPPPLPSELRLESLRRALGRDKRRVFRRFLRELQTGKPQTVVVGGPATGKSVLISALAQAVSGQVLNLSGEFAQSLLPLAESLGIGKEADALLAQLSPTQPYALQGSIQKEFLLLLASALNRQGQPLLLRAESEGRLMGLPLRGEDGETKRVSAWLEPFLKALKIPYLAALSDPPPHLPYQPLSPPTREEARRFVRERLPHLSPERVEALVNQAGRNFAELSRLVLLEAAKHDPSVPLQEDPALKPLLLALAAFSPEADPAVPIPLLEKALGKPIERLSQAERALLEPAGDGLVRPALRGLLPEEVPPHLHKLALEFFPEEDIFRRLYHARHAGERSILLDLLKADPSRLALLPGLWEESRTWPKEAREALAAVVVRYRAVLGQYTHPEAQEALEILSVSEDPRLRTWARIKYAEAQADAGAYPKAAQPLPSFEDLHLLDETAKAEGLLVLAAVDRWRGDYEKAASWVAQAEGLKVEPFLKDRVFLWRGLVAKDMGRYQEALEALAQVRHDPLLLGRARYQMGDLLMRLGEAKARQEMEEALRLLEEAGTPKDELARIRARYGTLLRRLGIYEEAEEALKRALEEAEDPFTRARVESEASVLEAARGRSLEALELAARAEAFFRKTQERPKEALYRHLRTLFRMGAAYFTLETGLPYRPPYLGGLEAPEARRLLEDLLGRIPEEPTDRYTALRLDTLSLLNLLKPPEEAIQNLKPFMDLENPYLRAQARLSYAEALARANRFGEALAQVVALPLPDDPGLGVWAKALETWALFGLGEEEAAWERVLKLRESTYPRAFKLQFGRILGRLLLTQNRIPETPLAPPEALGLYLANSE